MSPWGRVLSLARAKLSAEQSEADSDGLTIAANLFVLGRPAGLPLRANGARGQLIEEPTLVDTVGQAMTHAERVSVLPPPVTISSVPRWLPSTSP